MPPKVTFPLPPNPPAPATPTAHAAWTVLDTDVGDAQHLLRICHAGLPPQGDASSTGLLHYVGLLQAADAAALPTRLAQALANTAPPPDPRLAAPIQPPIQPSIQALIALLVSACAQLTPGSHRIPLHAGRVSLTLHVLPSAADIPNALSELRLQADRVLLRSAAGPWDKARLQALCKLCRSGALLQLDTPQTLPPPQELAFMGLHSLPLSVPVPVPDTEYKYQHAYEYRPRWRYPRRPHPSDYPAPTLPLGARHGVVIGAGLAGASVARALALRGLHVTVLDPHASPAQGASGLPAGLLVPKLSADDNPAARLSRSGVQLMLAHARAHLRPGQDWAHTGVQERPQERPPERARAQLGKPPAPLWHAQAGWLKPAAMVQAWLAHPRIRFVGHTHVRQLKYHAGQWLLRDAQGALCAQADVVVLANAYGCQALLEPLANGSAEAPPLAAHAWANVRACTPMYGSVSHGPQPTRAADLATFPPFPVNGSGSFIPAVPQAHGLQWLAGASYETEAQALSELSAQRAIHWAKLHALLPEVARALESDFASATLPLWAGQRCVSHDRLPLVGALQAQDSCTLWLCAAMGSRGISLAALCAELLAAHMWGEPWPVSASLAHSLHAQRPQRPQRPKTPAKQP